MASSSWGLNASAVELFPQVRWRIGDKLTNFVVWKSVRYLDRRWDFTYANIMKRRGNLVDNFFFYGDHFGFSFPNLSAAWLGDIEKIVPFFLKHENLPRQREQKKTMNNTLDLLFKEPLALIFRIEDQKIVFSAA